MEGQDIYAGETRAEEERKEPAGEEGKVYRTDSRQESYPVQESGGPEGEKRQKKGEGFFRKLVMYACMGICFGLFAGLGFLGAVQAMGGISPGQEAQQSPDPVSVPGIPSLGEREDEPIRVTDTQSLRVVTTDFSEVVEEVMPAMVSINNSYTERYSYFGQALTRQREFSGSGIIIAQSDEELIMATNYHVVEDAEKLEVTLIDKTTALAQVKGTDADMDLAVIAVALEDLTPETKQAICVAVMGDSGSIRMGEPVIAIGNALGSGQSVCGGYISAVDRKLEFEDGSSGVFIQTDAAINPGNSGGALINRSGEVIGINSSKISDTDVEGMGFAIPISAARPIIEQLMLKETRVRMADGQEGYMGITPQTITKEFAFLYSLPSGVYVASVEEGSPAQEAGMRYGDIITRLEGEKVGNTEELSKILQYYGPGSEITVTIERQGQDGYASQDLKITLGVKPQQ